MWVMWTCLKAWKAEEDRGSMNFGEQKEEVGDHLGVSVYMCTHVCMSGVWLGRDGKD